MQKSHGSYAKFNFLMRHVRRMALLRIGCPGGEWGAPGGFNGVFFIISPDSGSCRGYFFQYR